MLDGLDTLRICTGYRFGGRNIGTLPPFMSRYAECEPRYEELEGWQDSTCGVTRWEDLPARARAYIRRLEELVGLEACIVSTGPAREQTIVPAESPPPLRSLKIKGDHSTQAPPRVRL